MRPQATRPGFVALTAAGIGSVFLSLPIAVVVLMSFNSSRYLEFPPPAYSLRWYENVWADESWRQAVTTSAGIAAIVSLAASLIGGLAAFGFVRARPCGGRLLWAMALSPLIVPGIVIAVGSYLFFARLGIVDTPLALVLTHTVLALPVVLVSVGASLRSADETLEVAARTLGATPAEVTWHITLPLVRPGILIGALFAFVTSFDEPILCLFIAGTRTVTLPKRMWDGIQYEIDPTSAAVSALLIGLAVSVVLVVDTLRCRSIERAEP